MTRWSLVPWISRNCAGPSIKHEHRLCGRENDLGWIVLDLDAFGHFIVSLKRCLESIERYCLGRTRQLCLKERGEDGLVCGSKWEFHFRELDVVERHQPIDLIHLGASGEPHHAISRIGTLLFRHLDSRIEIDVVAFPLIHLRLVDQELVGATGEGTRPCAFRSFGCLGLCLLRTGRVRKRLCATQRADKNAGAERNKYSCAG